MLTADSPNSLFFGDCLDVMREELPSNSIDLVYLDPPFNSKRIYNIFIDEKKGTAQKVAFDDTWQWYEAVGDFHAVAGKPAYAKLMEGLRLMLGEGSELAYLSYMANRLDECKRVMKDSGSIYLHCDPTMSHYLKAVMDGLFADRGSSETTLLGRGSISTLTLNSLAGSPTISCFTLRQAITHSTSRLLPSPVNMLPASLPTETPMDENSAWII